MIGETLATTATIVAGGLTFAGGYYLGTWYGESLGYLRGLLDDHDVHGVPRP